MTKENEAVPVEKSLREQHCLALDWTRLETQIRNHPRKGEVYHARTGSHVSGPIELTIGRHPQWPMVWHIAALGRDQVFHRIVGDEDTPGPLLSRVETFAERWALAGSMPNTF